MSSLYYLALASALILGAYALGLCLLHVNAALEALRLWRAERRYHRDQQRQAQAYDVLG